MLSSKFPAITKTSFVHILLCVSLCVAYETAASASEYVLIAHKDVPVNSLRKRDVRSIFHGEMTRWDDGKPLKFAILGDEQLHRSFMQNVIGKTAQQYLNYWRKKIYNGEALAPKTFKTAEEEVRFVANTSGSIGYVSASDVNDSVKIILIK